MPSPFRVACDCRCQCGENPMWHPEERRIYWTDIPSHRLHRLDPADGKHETFDVGRPVGGFTIQQDGALLLFMDRGGVAEWRDGDFGRTVLDELPGVLDTRFNDVAADPEGRVFCGTMPGPDGEPARLYRLDPGGVISLLRDDVGLANGIGFSPDLTRLYFADTVKRVITRYAYEPRTGDLRHPEVFHRSSHAMQAEHGAPDGLTIDADGCLWIARWGGACLLRLDPTGRVIERHPLPARRVTCPIFGGDQLDQLYVTTASGAAEAPDDPRHDPLPGRLFVKAPGVLGKAEFRSRI